MAEKKPRAAKAPKPPATTEELVIQALKKAATKPSAKWSGASGTVLFNTNDVHHTDAITECTKGDRPLLKQTGKTGALTAAGFEKVAGDLSDSEATAAYERLSGELTEDQVGPLVKVIAGRMPLPARIEFIRGVLGRTPLAAPELTPVLEAAVAAAKVEDEARLAAAKKRVEAERAAETAMARALELFVEHRKNRLDALRREYEIEGGKASELPDTKVTKVEPQPQAGGPEPKTDEEKDFRRECADQFASSWRQAWDAKKSEALEYLEATMWNISALKPGAEAGTTVPFDGRYHESAQAVFTNDTVRIVRPGWVLDEGSGRDYVALKAVVEKV